MVAALETERLVGEPASAEHRDFVAELFGEPEVARWIWPEGREGSDGAGPRTPAQAEELLQRFLADWDSCGFGWWFLRERAGGRLVGDVVLQRAEVEGEQVVEVGWMMLPAFCGRATRPRPRGRRSRTASDRPAWTRWSPSRCRTTSRHAG
ncbi:MAG TPA: GNAT family N-acetyltransferase [Thermoleophilaceae bacterium]|nr:GNAT family N-acetyltransferase [Thermoleophilaceae bacterium]